LRAAGFHIDLWKVAYLDRAQARTLKCQVKWRAKHSQTRPPAFLKQLAQHARVLDIQWNPVDSKD
jgi:hypothetical protein